MYRFKLGIAAAILILTGLAAGIFLVEAASSPLAGRILINSGAEYTNIATVNLGMSCKDPDGRTVLVSLSGDGQNWSPDEVLRWERLYKLPDGDGKKTVYARFRVEGEPYSEPVADSIILDTGAPGISNISVKRVNAKSVELTFSTNEPCWCSLSYGKSSNNYGMEQAESGDRDSGIGFATEHRLVVEKLAKGKYYFVISAFDQAGNCGSSKRATFTVKG